VTRAIAAAAAVTVVVGALTAVLSLAIARDWVSGGWADALLAIGAVTVIVAAGWIVISVVMAGLLRGAAFILAPSQPPGLVRIVRIMEQHAAESETRRPPTETPPSGVTSRG
jgi:hypothetical protein